MRLPSDSESPNEKTRGRFPGAGSKILDDEGMPVICPTCQILLERPPIFVAGNSLSRIPAPVARSVYR
jgi:hypothetical protein